MYVSLDWLKQFTEIPKGVTPEELASTLTLKTAEVEGFSKGNELLDGVVIGFVKELKAHPNADKLKLVKVSIGAKGPEANLVCGGNNLKEGMYVAYAAPGCKVKWHGEGEPVVIEKVKIRGEESEGMICASDELGLEKPKSEGAEGILDLSAIKPTPGTPLAETLGLSDIVLEFDNKSLTHRPDLWGTYGIAREISTIYKTPFKKLNPKPKIPKQGDKVTVDIHSYELCPRYCGVIIKNIKVQPSPEWMQRRLRAVGHKTYNNIVDVTNYISSELGQPLHAFDRNLIKKGIVVRTANKGESIKAIDEKTYRLKEEMLVIADHKDPIAIAGVMGGHGSGITENTTEIIIESANFNGANVRRTATALGLRTEAVQRFEKQLDPNLALTAMERAIGLILEVSPGAIVAGPITDNHKFDKRLPTISLDLERVTSKIGVHIPKKEIIDILTRLQFHVTEAAQKSANKNPVLKVQVPSFRAQKDVRAEDDLIEEIARIYGYDNIPPVLPKLPITLPIENPERETKHELRKLLTLGLGFNEIMTYSFYAKEDFENCGLPETAHVQIENYLSEDQTHMRTSLIPNLLKKIALNSKYTDEFRLFEIGRTYKNSGNLGDYFPLEEKWVAGSTSDFYTAKGAVVEILRTLKLPPCKFVHDTDETLAPYAHPVQSATLMTFKGETLGRIFTIHPQTAKNFGIEKIPTACFELNFSLAMRLDKFSERFKELPKFPGIVIDVSVLIDETIEIETLNETITKADKPLIKDVTLFDLYKGDNVPKGKKAVAFKITLQAQDRTLTDEDMKDVQQKIFKNLQQLGGTIRGL